MKKLFLFALLLPLFAFAPVMAQETDETSAEGQEELNAFGYPDKSLVTIIENHNVEDTVRTHDLPECDNEALLTQVRQTIEPFIHFEGSTIHSRRKTVLTLKNIDNFVILPPEDIDAKNHAAAAARVIELKINNHLSASDIEICQSDNPILGSKIYLALYPTEGSQTQVEILNFLKDKIPSFIFQP